MKKLIIISIIVVVLIAIGLFFIYQKSTPTEKTNTTSPQISAGATLNTNDNLDQALEDLNKIK